jgi:hypothetical protein
LKIEGKRDKNPKTYKTTSMVLRINSQANGIKENSLILIRIEDCEV